MANDAQIIIGADTSELVAALKGAQQAVSSSVADMKGSLSGLGAAFGGLQSVFVGFAAIMGGGKIFKDAIQGSLEEAAAVKQLTMVMGMTTAEASKLNLQLKLVGISTEDYTGMAMKLDKQLRTNEDGLKQLGVQTRNSKGELLDQKTVMQNAVSTMNEYKAGTDRNIVAQQMFGKGAQEANQLFKLTAASQATANRLQEAGIGPTKASIEAAIQYKLAMSEAKLITGEFADSLGESVIPSLTEIAKGVSSMVMDSMPLIKGFFEAFGSIAMALGVVIKEVFLVIGEVIKGAMSIFSALVSVMTGGLNDSSDALKAFLVVWEFFKLGIQTVSEVIKGSIQSLVIYIRSLGEAITKALNFDFSGSANSWNAGMAEIKGVASKHLKAVRDDVGATQKVLNGIVGGEGGESAEKSKGSKLAPKEAGSSRVSEWDAKLAEAKVYYQKENDLREMSKEQEKAYWQGIKKTQLLTQSESIDLRKKVAALDLDIMKKSVKDGQGLAKEAIAEYQRNGLDEISIEEEKAKRKKDLGDISSQELIKLQQTYQNQRYAIEEIAQNARIELQRADPSQDPVALQVQLDKLLELRQKHSKQVEVLNTTMANQVKSDFESMLAPISNAVSTSVQGMIQGTTTLKAAMANLMQSILASFVSAVTGMVTKWAAAELAKTGLAQAWSAVRQALMGEEAVTAVIAKKIEAAAMIPAETAIAAMGAASAVAGIPIIGPGLAVAAAAEMSIMGAGYMALASASGGFDIPAGANPLTQLHASEMVLPAHIANPLRDSLAGGGIGGGGSTVNINATPMKGGFLMMHKEELAKAIKSLHRDNMIKFA